MTSTLVTAKHFDFLQSTGKKPKLKADDVYRSVTAIRYLQMLVEQDHFALDAEGKKMFKSLNALTPVLHEAYLNATMTLDACPIKLTGRPLIEEHDRY